MTIGQKVQKLLADKGMTQYRLSELSGVSTSYLSELISDKYTNPSINIVIAVADALEVSVSELLEPPKEAVNI